MDGSRERSPEGLGEGAYGVVTPVGQGPARRARCLGSVGQEIATVANHSHNTTCGPTGSQVVNARISGCPSAGARAVRRCANEVCDVPLKCASRAEVTSFDAHAASYSH